MKTIFRTTKKKVLFWFNKMGKSSFWIVFSHVTGGGEYTPYVCKANWSLAVMCDGFKSISIKIVEKENFEL